MDCKADRLAGAEQTLIVKEVEARFRIPRLLLRNEKVHLIIARGFHAVVLLHLGDTRAVDGCSPPAIEKVLNVLIAPFPGKKCLHNRLLFSRQRSCLLANRHASHSGHCAASDLLPEADTNASGHPPWRSIT